MNHQVWSLHSAMRVAVALALCVGSCALATAQGFRGGGGGFPSAEDSFRRLDLDQNGQIDAAELQQVDGSRRGFLTQMGIDGSRPISLKEYTEKREKLLQSGSFQQQFRGGGGPPSSGGPPQGFGGPPGGIGGPPGGGPPGGSRPGESERRDESRSEESNRDRRDDRNRDDRDRDRSSSSSSKSSKKKDVKPKARITHNLPADYRDKDKNGDGQIGLYEWDRKAFAQFYALDRNGDGLLTPDELIAATKKSSASSKSSSKAEATASSEDSKGVASTETAKPSDASATKPASPESSPGVKSFVSLDSNHDGKLSEEEWKRSRTTRGKFAKAGVEITFPIQQAQFVELYDKVEAQ